MAEATRKAIGIEIGGTKLQIVIGDSEGQIIDRWRGSVVASEGRAGICTQLEQALSVLRGKHSAQAVGVGFGGPVDWRSGQTIVSHQISGWEHFTLGAWLAETTGLPVAVDNDANVAALGEAIAGAGRGLDPVFYVTLGSGVGGGCVAQGKIFHGAIPGEAELGHLRLNRAGDIVEQCCSGWAVDRRIRAAAADHPKSLLVRSLGSAHGKESEHLSAALRVEDPLAIQILTDVAGDLALALSHVVHLIHPAVIVVGGGLSLIGEPLRAAVAEAISPLIMKAFAPGPPIRLATLREDAVPIGALQLARALQQR